MMNIMPPAHPFISLPQLFPFSSSSPLTTVSKDHAYSAPPWSWCLCSWYAQTWGYLGTKSKGKPYLRANQQILFRYQSKPAFKPRLNSSRHSSLKFVYPAPDFQIFKQGLRWSCSPSCVLTHQGRQWSVLQALTQLDGLCGSTRSWTQLCRQGRSTQIWLGFLE